MQRFHQGGIALIATLIVVVIVAMIGSSVIIRTITGKKNSNSMTDFSAAYYATLSAMQAAENEVKKSTAYDGFPMETSADGNWWGISDNWSSDKRDIVPITGFHSTSSDDSFLVSDPLYNIERIDTGSSNAGNFNASANATQQTIFYRITAKGKGRAEASLLLQSIYVRNL